MAVVIRLQGLRISAGSDDIRNFFTGLKIPDGGVHIIGGEQEEAFIIFASDEDARRAMTRSGGCIRGSPVNLLLSSKSEMQSILEKSARNAELNQKSSLEESSRRLEMDVPAGARRAGHLEAGRPGSRPGHSPLPQQRRASSTSNDDLYVNLKGLPFSVTELEISQFFHGLLVDGVLLLKNHRGQNNGKGLVKFATRQDAREGLTRDREYIGPRFVEVFPATEQQWLVAGGNLEMGVDGNGKFGVRKSPVRGTQHRVRSRSPLAQKSTLPPAEEFCVLLENLSYAVEKGHIKEFFHHARLEDDQILYLLDNDGRRTRSVFVLFKYLRDYCAALTRHKEELDNRLVRISPISREKMISILESPYVKDGPSGRSDRFEERPPCQPGDPSDFDKVCLYVRNMPCDVRKVEIMDFFFGFNITEDRVILLRDQKGAGLGEALVVFRSEEEAMNAESQNGQRFLGSEVMLKCISRSQMREFDIEPPAVQEPMLREERYLASAGEASYPGDMEYPDVRIHPDGCVPTQNLQVHRQGGSYDPFAVGPSALQDVGNGSVHGGAGLSAQHFGGPTCLKLVNLPSLIKIEEIYDFFYGYRVIPGSVSLQYDRYGMPRGSATVVFESREEALTALKELNGRPIGARRIHLVLV